jgi:serine/threonine protein kinase
VKPDNIAVQPDFSVKLFDWSEALLLDQLAGLSDKQLARHAGIAGTPLFMPPEVLLHMTAPKGGSSGSLRQLTTPALDVWGLGTVLFFLLAGRDILQDGSGYDLCDMAELLSTSRGIQLPPGTVASPAARDFLQCCLQRDPQQRASAQALLEHPWLAGPAAAAAATAAEPACADTTSNGSGGASAGASGYAASALRKMGGSALPTFSPPMSPHGSPAYIRTALYGRVQRVQSDASLSASSAPDTPSSTSTGLTVGA